MGEEAEEEAPSCGSKVGLTFRRADNSVSARAGEAEAESECRDTRLSAHQDVYIHTVARQPEKTAGSITKVEMLKTPKDADLSGQAQGLRKRQDIWLARHFP